MGGPSADHLDDAQSRRLPGARRHVVRQRSGNADDTEVRAAHPALDEQRLDDPARGGVDGHREAESEARDRGVDPDDPPRGIGERATGVARIERGVGLDDVLDHAGGRSLLHRDRAPERAHHARGDRTGEPERAAHGDDELADHEVVRVAETGGRGSVAAHPEHGQIRQRVGPDHVEVGLAAVGERRRAVPPATDHVGVGEEMTVVGVHHRRTTAAREPHARHVRGHRARHRAHHARVGVERPSAFGVVDVVEAVGVGHARLLRPEGVVRTRHGPLCARAGRGRPPFAVG